MRSVFFLLLVCCFAAPSPAQPLVITLNGSLIMSTGETFPYKVALTEVNGMVNGYSLTYKEPDETKTLLKGTLDRQGHTLSFKETEIVYSHNVRTKAYMCLVNAKLAYTQGGNGNTLKGPITSMQADKTSCTSGQLVFSNNDEIQFLFGYHDKYDTIINMKKRNKEPVAGNNGPAAATSDPPLITDKITTGTVKTYDWHTDTVVIDIWDGGNIDGDRVTIAFNGKAYLSDYFLVKEKKQLRIPLKDGINTLAINADNEGSDPPNTATMLLTDGDIKYSILAYNNKGQQSIIKIKKVKP